MTHYITFSLLFSNSISKILKIPPACPRKLPGTSRSVGILRHQLLFDANAVIAREDMLSVFFVDRFPARYLKVLYLSELIPSRHSLKIWFQKISSQDDYISIAPYCPCRVIHWIKSPPPPSPADRIPKRRRLPGPSIRRGVAQKGSKHVKYFGSNKLFQTKDSNPLSASGTRSPARSSGTLNVFLKRQSGCSTLRTPAGGY